MGSTDTTPRGLSQRALGVLAVGFGTAVAMWAVGYVGRLPLVGLPGPAILSLLLLCLLAGGSVAGRRIGPGASAGFMAGLVCGSVNLMILGSFLVGGQPGSPVPTALLWVPGSILISGTLAGIGAAAAARVRPGAGPPTDWLSAFVRVTIVATLLLLGVGGLVTSAEAGLAVADWPRSFGYNMFLYPFSRMTGNIYYEHAHRLFGALVGLTTLVLATVLQRVESRRWVRRLGWLALGLVILQGLLGGLRVTGRFTWSESPEAMTPNIMLALAHGVLAQMFFSTLVALGAFTSSTWKGGTAPVSRPESRWDRLLLGLLLGLLVLQLVLGAVQRHLDGALVLHILTGVALVAPLALHVGFRAWGMNPELPLLRRMGLALAGGTALQLLLGLASFVATRGFERGLAPTGFELAVATLHQWLGAVLMGLAVLLFCWYFRLVRIR